MLHQMKITNDITKHVHQEISDFRSEIQSQMSTFEGKHDTMSKRHDALCNEMKAVFGNMQQDLQSMQLEQNQRERKTEITELSRQTATTQHQVEEYSCQGIT